MKHLGDITKLNGTELPIVDIITGGSPCQDLSVAGKRAGLSGERSGLFMDQIRIIKEMRDEDKRRRCGITGADEYIRPRYMVWENVPGAFSSNKGEDFRAVLEETAKVADENAVIPEPPKGKWTHAGCIVGDGWSIAWRLHDSQWWGVPQRRKRICLLADFNGDTAGRILFELQRKTPESDTEQAIVDIGTEPEPEVQSVSKGVPGNIAESREEGQRIAEDTERCAGEAGGIYDVRISSDGTKNWRAHCYETERCRALDTGGEDPNSNHGGIAVVAFEPGAMSRVGGHAYEDVAGTVRANAGDNQQAVVYGIGSYDSNAMKSDNPHSGIYEADTSRTLDLNGGNPGCNQGGMAVVCIEGNGQRESHKGDGYKESDTMYTLNTVEQHAVCIENHPADSRVKIAEDGICQTLSGRMGTGGGNVPMVMERQEPVVLYNNQNNAGISQNGICNTLPASAGMGGGYVPMVVEPQTFSDIASCLSAADGTKGVHSQMMKNPEENFVLEPVAMEPVALADHVTPKVDAKGVGFTLNSRDYKDPQVVAYGLDRASYNQGINAQYDFRVEEEKIGTQVAKGPGAVCQSVVRRLTPTECELLQGFPRGWTDIGDWVDSKGKKHKGESDSPRYKALGNSIALPFWQWMADRMVTVLKNEGVKNPTMASLFDGIGGFPISFSEAGCTPVWASEVEDFCIAVTKKHFPDIDI